MLYVTIGDTAGIKAKTQVVKLKVNKTMQKQLDALCDYRRYCWNKGLETWQLMYEAHTLNKKR